MKGAENKQIIFARTLTRIVRGGTGLGYQTISSSLTEAEAPASGQAGKKNGTDPAVERSCSVRRTSGRMSIRPSPLEDFDMNMLLSTTAIVVALGFPAMTLAQTNHGGANQTASQQKEDMRGFLANRSQSDVFASELLGHDVYARRTSADETATGNRPTGAKATTDKSARHQATTGHATGNRATMNRADLDRMDNIGEVNEIVLSSDGQVRALVIGVGGFLGMGERDVAVTMDQVTFASDPEDRSEMYIVVNTGAKMLKDSPAYDRTAKTTDRNHANAQSRAERTAFVAPNVKRDGYDRVAAKDVSSEMLVGKSVYGVNEKSVGTIDGLILDDKGAIENVIIDFGGFLGIGTSQVSVGYDELTVLANKGRKDVRVYVDGSKELIQAQPKYRATE